MEIFEKVRIDGGHLLAIGIIIVCAVVLTRLLQWLLRRFIRRSSETLKVDPTRYRFFSNALTFIITTVATFLVIYSIPQLRSLALTLFAGAGILVAIIGFAAQQAFANIVSGIFIVASRPYRVGDLIRVAGEHYGIVEDITLRHTVITDFQNRRIIIPNAVMNSETIINSDIGQAQTCEFIEIGISYDSDIDLAMRIMREEASAHPGFIDVRTEHQKMEGRPAVDVRVTGFGDSSVNLRAPVWSATALKAREMSFDLNKAIKERFDREGVEIPFPYRTIVYKKDLSPPTGPAKS